MDGVLGDKEIAFDFIQRWYRLYQIFECVRYVDEGGN